MFMFHLKINTVLCRKNFQFLSRICGFTAFDLHNNFKVLIMKTSPLRALCIYFMLMEYYNKGIHSVF